MAVLESTILTAVAQVGLVIQVNVATNATNKNAGLFWAQRKPPPAEPPPVPPATPPTNSTPPSLPHPPLPPSRLSLSPPPSSPPSASRRLTSILTTDYAAGSNGSNASTTSNASNASAYLNATALLVTVSIGNTTIQIDPTDIEPALHIAVAALQAEVPVTVCTSSLVEVTDVLLFVSPPVAPPARPPLPPPYPPKSPPPPLPSLPPSRAPLPPVAPQAPPSNNATEAGVGASATIGTLVVVQIILGGMAGAIAMFVCIAILGACMRRMRRKRAGGAKPQLVRSRLTAKQQRRLAMARLAVAQRRYAPTAPAPVDAEGATSAAEDRTATPRPQHLPQRSPLRSPASLRRVSPEPMRPSTRPSPRPPSPIGARIAPAVPGVLIGRTPLTLVGRP